MKYLKYIIFAIVFLLFSSSIVYGATVLFPSGGGTGTSTPPTYGKLLVGNANGTYSLMATSSLGLGGSSGTVSSVAMTVPTGFSISGSPVTSSGTLGLTFTAGYFLPTTTRASTWDTAYSWGNHALAGYLTSITSGNVTTALGYTPLNQASYFSTTTHSTLTTIPNLSITKSQVSDFGTYQAPISLTTTGTSGAATFVANTLNIPQYAGGAQTPWTSIIDGAGYALTNVGTITATNFVATSTTATSTFAGDVTATQVSIFNQNSGANRSLLNITPTKTYGSSSQNQGDGALLVSCSSNNGLCTQTTRNNASAVAPLNLDYITNASDAYTVRSIITAGTGAALTLSQTNSSASQSTQTITNAGNGAGLTINMTKTTSTSPGLRITATSTQAAATTVLLEQPFYVTIAMTDLSKTNSVGEGKFQLTNRNDSFRFEGRQSDNSQYNVAGIFNRPNSGGQFVWGGTGDIFSVPSGVAMFNVVMSSSTVSDYLNLTSTTTSPSKYGDIFTVKNSGNIGIGTTTPGSLLSIGSTGTGINFFDNATSTFSKGINLNGGCFSISGVCIGAGGGTGLSTSSPISESNLLVYSSSGAGSAYGVATSSLSVGTSITSSGTLGSLTGGTASSLSLNMGNANTWTALQTFTNSSTTNASFSIASSTTSFFGTVTSTVMTIVNKFVGVISSAFTPSTEGEMGIDTTSNQFKFFSNGAVRVVVPDTDRAFILATSTMGTGTTTRKIAGYYRGTTFTQLGCNSSGSGTFVFRIGNGTASTTSVISATGNTTTFTALSSNNSFTSGQAIYLEFGSVSGSVSYPTCSYNKTPNKD